MQSQQWLHRASVLLGCSQVKPLIAEFLDGLAVELPLEMPFLLLPTIDGRELDVVATQPAFSQSIASGVKWAVDDFEHPFSHALQSQKTMILDHDTLLYWQGHSGFMALTLNMKKDQHLVIYPLNNDKGAILGILVLALPESMAMTLVMRQDWQSFVAVFTRHWQLLESIRTQDREQSLLSDSIVLIRKDKFDKEQAEQLSHTLVGCSELMQSLRKDIIRVGQSELAVMIQGQTGTGKELVAQGVHDYSKRKDQPFIAINCAAIPDNLLESELFGYEKGAFSGADSAKKGLIAAADGGSLFLDEIGDMPLLLQTKLLRVLESRQFRALGAAKETQSNFRLIVASHVDLKHKSRTGEFRQDLFYRLCQFPISIPALKDRASDLPELVTHFIHRFNASQERHVPGIRFSALDRLLRHDYPGNVRELRNIVEYACALTLDGQEIDLGALPTLDIESENMAFKRQLNAEVESVSSGISASLMSHFDEIDDLKEAVSQFERAVIEARLIAFSGDRGRAADSLGLPKRTLAHKCIKLEIS
ncbi:sigma-54 interaction domain-containing protein [Shewanella surugensis]|uniref:Sigma-54 dependent transcriptional regulator n=1 Tax=Shewanella surugensis TaxID=212020 RepID=A0ABT0LD02_9GAMM|nr:sigma-54 dependent transcriptional regulator [Shewanella surugensis]MCL1125540.1 sigma-54 dependent transcriptional regulator [Shewanella surugensis]